MKTWLSGLPREKADIMLLLLAAAMVLAPHALHLEPGRMRRLFWTAPPASCMGAKKPRMKG